MNAKLPQTVVLFDAVGTVIKPVPSVIETYERLGKAHGSQLPTLEIKQRIKHARQKHFHVGTEVPVPDQIDLSSSDSTEYQLWKQLVLDVFTELDSAEALFEDLWQHFDSAKNWQLYDDVVPCWNLIRDRGWLIGLASNFDSRLLSISKQIPLLNSADFIFHSAGVGFRKPSNQFYLAVEKSIHSAIGPATILMTGDDLGNDCLAPLQAGWTAMWLNRDQENTKVTGAPSNFAGKFQQVKTLLQFYDGIQENHQ